MRMKGEGEHCVRVIVPPRIMELRVPLTTEIASQLVGKEPGVDHSRTRERLPRIRAIDSAAAERDSISMSCQRSFRCSLACASFDNTD